MIELPVRNCPRSPIFRCMCVIEVVLGDTLSGSVWKNVAAGRLHAVNVVAEGDVG